MRFSSIKKKSTDAEAVCLQSSRTKNTVHFSSIKVDGEEWTGCRGSSTKKETISTYRFTLTRQHRHTTHNNKIKTSKGLARDGVFCLFWYALDFFLGPAFHPPAA
jgi:hypothetical protein